MVFVSNINGTLTKVSGNPIYQGSSLVNEIVLIAPFSPTNIVTVGFTLPNGVPIDSQLMTSVPLGSIDVKDLVGNTYNAWILTVDAPVTEFIGPVSVYFKIYTGYTKVGDTLKPSYLTTSASAFEVTPGGYPTDIPTTDSTDIWEQVLSAFATIQQDLQAAKAVAIESIEYSSNALEIPTGLTDNSVNGYSGTFTIGTMQRYIGDLQGNYWYKGNGFTMTFNPFKCGIIQMRVFGNEANKVGIQVDIDDSSAFLVDVEPIETGYISIVRIYVNQPVNSTIKISFDGEITVQAIEVYAQSLDGIITIRQKNGAISTIPTFDAQALITELEAIQSATQESATEAEVYANEAKTSEENAQSQYQALLEQKGYANGLAPLGADGKVPTNYLPPLVITDYIKVNSVADLTSTVAQKGDIAYIQTTVDNVTTTQFYILISNDYTVLANWLEYNPSTAGSALYADNAKEAENAQKVGGVPFDGIYTQAQFQTMVTNGTIVNGTIYVVEV